MSVFGDAELFNEFENAGEPDDQYSDEENSNASFQDDEFKEKYLSLKMENENLKRSLKILERPVDIKIKDAAFDGPIAHVLLFNNLITRKYREEIKDFFHDLANRRLGDDDTAVTEPQPTFIQFSSPRMEKRHKKSSKRESATKKAFQAFSSIQVYRKFFTDQLGEPLSFQDPSFSDWHIPWYEQSSFEPMTGDPSEGMQRKKKKIQRICFNCGETDHQIKDCEKSRDHNAINERRQKFLDEVAKASEGSPQIRLDGPRYHADDGEDNKERFACFRPGVISTDLQEALGITEDKIPPYIYQMRHLGYPPGHLRNARITQSGLLLYENSQTDGKEQANEYAPIDVDRIIGYPGFNIPPLPGQEDKFEEYYVPPMNDAQSKEVMITYFEHRNNLYNQRKLAEERESELRKENERREDGIDGEEIDMEMEDDEGDQNDEKEMQTAAKKNDRPPEPPSYELEDGEVDDIEGIEVGDLTEDELEIKREMLLKELTRQQNDNKNDSDYRNIKSNDHDYRIMDTEVVDLTETTSESDAVIQETVMQDDNQLSVDETIKTEYVLFDTSAEIETENTEKTIKGRNISSDTDYRMMPTISKENSPIALKTESENVDLTSCDYDSEEIPQLSSNISQQNVSEESGVPNREKFAKGITQFDAYYQESKSQGVYKKLRNLLKDSPRRQEK